MRLFYDPQIKQNDKFFSLNEEESKHICKVLRLKEGDQLSIINGKGSSFSCTITDAHPKHCQVKIDAVETEENPQGEIHIAIAPTKMMERLEWFLEKATEIGITEITPLLCKNSERKQIKDERLEKILVSAIKQSKRLYLPKLNPLTDFSEFLKEHPKGLLAHCYDMQSEKQSEKQSENESESEDKKYSIAEVFGTKDCPILIGPEGDFSLQEVEKALKSGYKTITLGKNRLRTETAGLYAVMQAKLILND